jgi:hypothetical protein
MAMTTIFVLLAGPVTIRNPKHRVVSEQEVNTLFHATCSVVARDFHLQDSNALDFPLTLVLGEHDEHYTADEDKRIYVIYLDNWNAGKFATSAMRLAVWRMVPRKRRDEMVHEILRWANTVDPVPLKSLRDSRGGR